MISGRQYLWGGVGQHTDEVLAEYGFTKERINEMRARKEIR